MNKKIISIAGLIFALIFVGMAFLMWSNSQSILRQQFDHINSIRRTEVPFDSTLFDNRVVTADSIKNITKEIETNVTSGRLKIYEDKGSSISEINTDSLTAKQYRSMLHYNDNGGIDGIVITQVD